MFRFRFLVGNCGRLPTWALNRYPMLRSPLGERTVWPRPVTLYTFKQRPSLLRVLLLESRIDRRRNKTRHKLCHHPCLFFEKSHEMHLILLAHLHHIGSSRARWHLHTTRLSTGTRPRTTILIRPRTSHMISTVSVYPSSTRLSTNSMKSGIGSPIHSSVDLIKYPPSTALPAVAHRFRSGRSRKK